VYSDYENAPAEGIAGMRPRLPLWKRMGGDGLIISVVFHGVLLFFFAAWVIVTITDEAKTDPETFATGSGGGAKGERAKVYEHKMTPRNAQNLARTSARITSKSATASVALPDLPTTSAPSLMAGLSGGGSSKGFGGGSGGGIGSGKGVGVGNSRNFVGVFGSKFAVNGLVGTFYDIKQTRQKRATEAKDNIGPYREAVRDFLNANWNPSKFSRYYEAPEPLYASQLFIPSRSANAAPQAYGVEKEVAPSRWVVHYKGNVKAPQSGTFRFVGSGDDWLLVRWNRKIALDDGYEHFQVGRDGNYKDFGQVVTQEFPFNRAPGGLARLRAGPWITVRKGDSIPMEILIGETPGGVFDVYLTIEVAKPQKSKNQFVGEGTLKLFRVTNDPLPEELRKAPEGNRIPNFDWEAEGWIFEAVRSGTAR
jgi:hypothetical protein